MSGLVFVRCVLSVVDLEFDGVRSESLGNWMWVVLKSEFL